MADHLCWKTLAVQPVIRKRIGKNLTIPPDGTFAAPTTRARVNSALLKSVARGFSCHSVTPHRPQAP